MQDPAVVTAPPAASSFLTRASNVFAGPGELYTEIAAAPVRNSSWSIPFIISVLLALVFTFSLYNNPALRQQVYDKQEQAMKKQVQSGSMTQEQYERMVSGMESSGPVLFMAFGGTTAAVMVTIVFFGITLLLWLVLKFLLKSPVGFKKILEAYGLSELIAILGTIITLLMMNFFNTMYATPSGAAFIMSSYDAGRILDRLLSALNIFTIWQVAVLGIAVQKITGKSTGVSMGVPFGLWAVWVILSTAFGWGYQ